MKKGWKVFFWIAAFLTVGIIGWVTYRHVRMNRIIAQLGKPELEKRVRAAQRLMNFRKPTEILATKPRSAWDNTVWALEQVALSEGDSPAGRKAVADIVLIARDLHTSALDGEAEQAVARLGERACPPLLQVLKSDRREYENPTQAALARKFAATLLGRIGSPQTQESLIEALQDESNGVRLAAAQALVKMGPEAAVRKALIPLLKPRVDILHGIYNCWVRLDNANDVQKDQDLSNNIPAQGLALQVVPLSEVTPEQMAVISSRQKKEREVSQEERQQAEARAALTELRQSQVGQRMKAAPGTVDLQVTGFDYQPFPPELGAVIEGQPVKFSVSFRNAGTGDNTQHFVVGLYLASPPPRTDRPDTRALAGRKEKRWSKWLRSGEEKTLVLEHAFTNIDQDRIQATYELGLIGLDKAGDQDAVAALCTATQDPSWVVRRNAVQALIKIGLMPGTSPENHARIVTALRQSLGNFERLAWQVLHQDAVQAAIREARPQEAESLQAALKEARHISEIPPAFRDPDLRKALEKALSDYDWQVVRRALYGRDASSRADDIVRYHAATGLGKLKASSAMLTLIATLQDRVWSVRQAATRSLGELQEEAVEDPLVAGSLVDPNPQVRLAALRVLGRLGTPSARSILLEAACVDPSPELRQDVVTDLFPEIPWTETWGRLVDLARSDPSPGVRAAATRLLADMDHPGNEKTFLLALQDRDGDVRATASRGLGRIGSARAVEALIAASKAEAGAYVGVPADVTPENPEQETPTDKDVRAAAVEALSRIGGTRAQKAIREALSDSSWKVLQQAISAIQKLGPRQAVPQLWAILPTPSAQSVFSRHQQALQEALPAKKKDALEKALETQRCSAELHTLLKLPEVSTDLEKALSPNEWKIFSEALAEMDTTARLIAIMKDETALLPVRVAAAQTLRTQRAEEAIEPLVDLLNHTSYQLKIAVSSALVSLGDPRGRKTLKEQLQSKNLDVRREAAKTIATMNPELINGIKGLKREQRNGLDMLLADLYQEGRFVYSFTVQALVELGQDNQARVREATRERLAQELDSTHPLARAVAAETLCRLGQPIPLQRIIELSTPHQESHAWVRLKAVEGLARIGGTAARQALQKALQDPDPRVQAAASQGLIHQGG